MLHKCWKQKRNLKLDSIKSTAFSAMQLYERQILVLINIESMKMCISVEIYANELLCLEH